MISYHGIQQNEQLVHASSQGHFGGFAGRCQTLIEAPNDWVETETRHNRHVKGGAQLRSPTPDSPFSVQTAAVMIKRSQSDKGRNLLVAELAKFRQLGNQCTG